jgi:hypothetical protein
MAAPDRRTCQSSTRHTSMAMGYGARGTDGQTVGMPGGTAADMKDTSGVEWREEGHHRRGSDQISCRIGHQLQSAEEPMQEEAMLSLELYRDYTRKEVHDIFAPDTPFTPQSGTWGLHGIIAVPDRPKDFLFFVTFGQ